MQKKGAPQPQASVNWPVVPTIPPAVSAGAVITAAHTNAVVQTLSDLWTDLQAAAAVSVGDPTTTKGDLIVRGASTLGALAVGTPGQTLVADAAQALGMRWATVSAASLGAVPATRQVIAGAGMSGGGDLSADRTLTANVQTVFGRTGNVALTAADISAGGGVPATRHVNSGTGLSGGGDLSADLTLAVVDDTTTQRVRISNGGTLVAARREVNFIAGTNITLVTADESANNRVSVTISAGGGGGGMTDPTTQTGDLIVHYSTGTTRLGTGGGPNDGKVLTADSSVSAGVRWAAPTGGMTDPTTTKGDLIVRGSVTSRLPVGTDGQILQADSTQSLGVKWAAAFSGYWTGGSGGTIYYNGGSVGIGTTNPLALFHIHGGVNENLLLAGMDWATTGAVGLNAANDANNLNIPMAFCASKFYFLGGGVGIGVATPGYLLDVNGDINIASGKFYRIGGAAVLGGGPGSYVSILGSRGVNGPIYQNPAASTPRVVIINMNGSTGAQSTATVYCDTQSSPTTVLQAYSMPLVAGASFSYVVQFTVPPGYYYKVNAASVVSIASWYEGN